MKNVICNANSANPMSAMRKTSGDGFRGGDTFDYGARPSVSSMRVPHGSVRKTAFTFVPGTC